MLLIVLQYLKIEKYEVGRYVKNIFHLHKLFIFMLIKIRIELIEVGFGNDVSYYSCTDGMVMHKFFGYKV